MITTGLAYEFVRQRIWDEYDFHAFVLAENVKFFKRGRVK